MRDSIYPPGGGKNIEILRKVSVMMILMTVCSTHQNRWQEAVVARQVFQDSLLAERLEVEKRDAMARMDEEAEKDEREQRELEERI